MSKKTKEADLTTFDGMWEEVSRCSAEQLPKSALAVVKEHIIPAAQAVKDHAQLMKGLLFVAKGVVETEDVGMDAGVRVLEEELLTPTFVTSPADVAFLHSMLGEMYSRYLDMSRYRIRDRTDPGEDAPLPADMKTWAPAQLERVAFEHYLRSVAEPDALAQEGMGPYTPLLTMPFDAESLEGQQRPTLLDFLGHRALEYFSNENSFLAEPANRFVLRDKAAFGDVRAFVGLSFGTEDVTSRRYRAIQVYQAMLRAKLAAVDDSEGGEARARATFGLASLDQMRIAFVRNSLKGVGEREVRGMAASALERVLTYAVGTAGEGPVLIALGDHCASEPIVASFSADGEAPAEGEEGVAQFDLPRALAYYERALAASAGGRNVLSEARATSAIANIKRTQLSGTAETVVAPGVPVLVSTSSRNIDAVTYRVVSLTQEEVAAYGGLRGVGDGNAERRSFLLQRAVVVPDTRVELGRVAGDYGERRVEFVVPAIASAGAYRVLMWPSSGAPDSSHFVVVPFTVSRIAVLSFEGGEGSRFIAVDRTTGAPLEGVKGTLYGNEWTNGARVRKELGSAISDSNGFIAFKEKTDRYCEVVFALSGDTLDNGDGYYASTNNNNVEPDLSDVCTYFFLDRNIYRPGQTVYFKGLHVLTDAKGVQTVGVNKRITVALRDANYQEKESVTLTTNDYGSFEGTFVAPAGGLMGGMQLVAEGGSAGFRVEEYKRPRFEVLLSAPSQAVRVGGSAKMNGVAKSFSGIPLYGAAVAYRVRRVARAPWFWGFWSRVPQWAGKSAEILTGTATADENGKFEVIFTAVPDEDLAAEKPEFEYSVSADVTDLTGETQSGTATMTVGYVALKVGVPLAEKMSLDELRSVTVALSDLNGNPIPATAEVSLEPLVSPFPAGCPFVSRLWQVPHRIAEDKMSFKRALPHFAYTDETAPSKWAREGSRFVRSVACNGSTSAQPIDLARGDLAPNAYYRVSVSATDSYGTAVSVSRTIQVYDALDPTSVSISSAETPSLRFSQPMYRVGDVSILRYGKRVRFDGLPQPVLVALSTPSRAGSLEWDRTGAKGVANVVVQQQSVRVTEKDRGQLTAVCAFVAYGRAFVATASAGVPWVEKQLSFEYVSFRNKLEPGQQEEWRIRVKSADPLARPDDVVAAEVVAALYDASLDSLAGNAPHSFSNGFHLFSPVTTNICVSACNFENVSGGTDIGYNDTSSWYGLNQNSYFPRLSWFDFPFRTDRPSPFFGGGMRMMCFAAPVMCEMAQPPPPPPPAACPPPPPGGCMKMSDEGMCRELQSNDLPRASGKTPPGSDAATDAPPPAVRTNLKETVFFMPTLRTEPDGTVVLRFTMGETLTRWRLLAFAHTTDLKTGSHNDGSIVTQKEVMVTPNPPRFLREGDSLRFAAKVTNMGVEAKEGTATLELMDGVSGAPLNVAFGLPAVASVPFRCGGGGQSSAVLWDVMVPFGGASVVTWRIVARAGRVGDGEESTLPVATNRVLVTETLPMSVRGGERKNFTLRGLAGSAAEGASATLTHESLTVEFTSNPTWYAVQALPYLMEFPHECSEQLFSRYYSNALAQHITQRQPVIARVLEAWRQSNAEAQKSSLSRNEELKGALLEETPWVLEAQSEERQRSVIALLFDTNRLKTERTSAVTKLRDRQMGDGGFAWFPGGQGSLFITQHIAMGLAHLAHLGVSDDGADGVQARAQAFCYEAIIKEYDTLLEAVKEGRAKLDDQHVSHHHLLFLYTESFASLHPKRFATQTKRPEVLSYYLGQAGAHWASLGLYGQALCALVHHRAGLGAVSRAIVNSLRERALHSEELGTYFRYEVGYAYHQAPIETQALMVEVFNEVAGDTAFVDDLRLWLLKNKQTKQWRTTKQTSEAVYALLLGGESWLEAVEPVAVLVGGASLPAGKAEPGTGYVKHRYSRGEVVPALGAVSVANPNKVPAWGAAYWQYFEAMEKVKGFEDTPLRITKGVHRVEVSGRGEVLRELTAGAGLRVGDRVRVRVEVRSDREMSFVHLKDMRASGLEPINVMSSYKWQDGLGYYESTKDLATHFFIDHLPKGTFVFEYTLVASQRGDFSNGITTMQCMYAPEFTSHSEGIRLRIK